MNKFPKFWYESNPVWGSISSIEDLRNIMKHQMDQSNFGQFTTKDEFLKQSFQHKHGSSVFGTRSEHSGKKSLYDFLIENNVDFSEL